MAEKLFFIFLFLFTSTVSDRYNSSAWEKIVGGTQTYKGEVNSMAALFKSGQHICGCSILDHYHILTAAHCISSPNNPNLYKVITGVHNVEDYHDDRFAKEYGVYKIIVHPGYMSVETGSDIAVLQTKYPIVMNTRVQPVMIPRYAHDTCELATVYGWGATSDGGFPSDILLKVTMPVIQNWKCAEKYRVEGYEITYNQVCCGFENGGKDSCAGDSGGPLLCNKPANNYQIGVVSYGIGCADGKYPGVYTRVAAYSDWIRDVQDDYYQYK